MNICEHLSWGEGTTQVQGGFRSYVEKGWDTHVRRLDWEYEVVSTLITKGASTGCMYQTYAINYVILLCKLTKGRSVRATFMLHRFVILTIYEMHHFQFRLK